MLEETLLLLQMSTMVQVSTNLQPAALPRALPGSVVVVPLPMVPVVVVDVPSSHSSFVTHSLSSYSVSHTVMYSVLHCTPW